MVIMSYDETAGFESWYSRRKELPIIGGFIYMGEDVEIERKRIGEYLKRICKDNKVSFPRDLHCIKSEGNKCKNASKVCKVKLCYHSTLGEFIRKGTYKGETLLANDRTGHYEIYMEAYEEGMHEICNVEDNILLNDEKASNLYQNMVTNYIKRSVFLNDSIGSNPINANAPTRVFGNGGDMDEEKNKEYQDASYSKNKYNQYESTNKSVIQQIFKNLSDSIPNAIDMGNSQFKRTISIYYGKDDYSDSDSNKNNFSKYYFLYLSDAICSIVDEGTSWESVYTKAKEVFGSCLCSVFTYSDIDESYNKALALSRRGDFFGSLCEIYKGKKYRNSDNTKLQSYYTKKMFVPLEKVIEENINSSSLSKMINEMDSPDHGRFSNNLDQGELYYLFSMAEKMMVGLDENKADPISKEMEFKLYDIGVSTYAHMGDYENAEECYHKCHDLKMKKYVDDSVFTTVTNRFLTVYNDHFKFKRAIQIGLMQLSNNKTDIHEYTNKELVNELHKYADCEDNMSPTYYKLYGSLGQSFAFLREYKTADYCFYKVINTRGEEKSEQDADFFITFSYYLHNLIECRNQKVYEEVAPYYFGGKEKLDEQLKYLIAEGSKKDNTGKFTVSYALFVFIKAFYTFYKEQPRDSEVIRELIDLPATFDAVISDKDHESLMNGHPWEIIYKYSYWLCTDYDEEELAELNKKRIRESVKGEASDTVDFIIKFGELEGERRLDDPEMIKKMESKVTDLWYDLCMKGYVSEDRPFGPDKYKRLEQLFTYMYH